MVKRWGNVRNRVIYHRCPVVSIMHDHLSRTRGVIFVFREQALCQNWCTMKYKTEINECDKKDRYIRIILSINLVALSRFPLWYCSPTYPVTDTPNSVALCSHSSFLPLEVLPTRCVPGYTITANRNLTLPSSGALSSSVFDTVLY